MIVFSGVLLVGLILCAVMACLNKNLLASIVIFMAFSSMMAMIWVVLESPDLAITEAAVGAGIDSVLFFITLKKINEIKKVKEETANEQA